MAVNTAERRFSMMGITSPFIKHPLPQGAFGAIGRATLLDLYSGIALNTEASLKIQEQWDYETENASLLDLKTSTETLDFKIG